MRILSLTIGLAGALCAAALLAAEPAQVGAAAQNKTSRYAKGAMPDSARRFYAATWGVDQLSVKLTESGQLVRFSYRVMDASKAAPLQDRASSPYLYDEETNAMLQIPVMDKVGPLRQSMPAENGKAYWMVFSNKGGLVQPGHRVSVMIGSFRVDGLAVQ